MRKRKKRKSQKKVIKKTKSKKPIKPLKQSHKSADAQKRMFIKFTFFNMLILFIGLSVYLLFWGWAVIKVDLNPVQQLVTSIVYYIQSLSGIPVEIENGITLLYSEPTLGVWIAPMCAGLGEMLFFAFLVVLFRGPKWKTKGIGLAIFLPIIFIINIARLLMLYPLAQWVGVEAMWDIHWHIWKWGMFVAIMLLFGVWYMLLARNDIESIFTPKRNSK